MTEQGTPAGRPPTELIIAELINAAEAVRTAMYNGDSEAGWSPAVDRWHAAVETAAGAFPGIKGLVETLAG